MALFVDLFGYLSVVLHGLTSSAQAFTLGGDLFIVLLARPLAPALGPDGGTIGRGVAAMTAIAAVVLATSDAAVLALDAAVLAQTIDLPFVAALTAPFAVIGLVKIVTALMLAVVLVVRPRRMPGWAASQHALPTKSGSHCESP